MLLAYVAVCECRVRTAQGRYICPGWFEAGTTACLAYAEVRHKLQLLKKQCKALVVFNYKAFQAFKPFNPSSKASCVVYLIVTASCKSAYASYFL